MDIFLQAGEAESMLRHECSSCESTNDVVILDLRTPPRLARGGIKLDVRIQRMWMLNTRRYESRDL